MAPVSKKNPPVVTGKRKRATISYAEIDNAFDSADDDEQELQASDENILTDDDDDDSFSTRRKVSHSTRRP